ncbi:MULTISPECIES: hypothetical protein [unclassified Crossiella]|uniref:hypothetical protein n=1 Tax=unclassified Crossiella TaxID=2620835 RepID=UPI001FFFEE47|nr:MULTISPECIES: hypothetical protein [unclassified Crossiella]MCK2241840.1 hypothetical protein [Crossiella sp. S99.2]MCK2255743.1 hypothetical protein [Crossiella sp. S99.1]
MIEKSLPGQPHQGAMQLAPDARAAALQALSLAPKPAAPAGPVGELTDRVLVHACFDTGYQLLDLLPSDVSGLVLRGAKANSGITKLRHNRYQGALVPDPEGYTRAAATEDEPFALPTEGGLFPVSLNDVLQAQLDAGATAAMTPTGYLPAGQPAPLKAAARLVERLDRDDFLFSVPIAVAWLSHDHFPQLLAILKRLTVPKAIMLGGQYDPMDRKKGVVANLRRLVAEAGHVAVFRTDLTAFDAMSHGAFAASIGTGGSLRHVVPFGQIPLAGKGKEKDRSPSVLFPELMSFHKGNLLAERFANLETPPACWCGSCHGRKLDTFLDKPDSLAAHAHGVHIWNEWGAEMRAQRVLGERAEWWQKRCQKAIDHCDTVNIEIGREDAFDAPGPLKAWAGLPIWPSTP